MKNLIIAIGLLVSFNISAQRFIPLIEDGREFSAESHGPVDRLGSAIEYEGKLLIPGAFEEVNGVEMRKLCYWDGINFSPFETPLPDLQGSNIIRDLIITPDGLIASGRYANMNNIVVYDGVEWSTVAEGLDDTVADIVVFEDELYAAGKFENSGSAETLYIAKFNGTEWVSVDGGMNDEVYDLEVFNGALYAVGDFTEAGGIACNYIARLIAGEWTPLGTGFDDNANCLSVIDDKLFIGGSFTGDGDIVDEYFGLASFDGMTTTSEYLGPEILSITSIVELDETIIISESGVGFTSFGSSGQSFILEDQEIKTLPELWPNVHQNIEYNGANYVLNSTGSFESGEVGLFSNNGIFELSLEGNPSTYIEAENVKGLVIPSATMFQSRYNQAVYEIGSLDPPVSTIYAASPWIGGMDDSEELFVGVQQYSPEEDEDFNNFYFGPAGDSYDSDYIINYNRVWSVSQADIDDHIANFDQPGYEALDDLLNWPGNGRYDLGERAHIAPFEDLDEDGLYEPMDGEYPVIRGDRCVFYLLNTDRNSLVDNIGCDLNVLLYTFDEMPNSVFANYQIFNLSDRDYPEFKFGMWADGDIGTGSDDYVGCTPSDDLYFFYNGDTNDEPSAGSPGFGEIIPTQGVKFLSHNMSSFMFYNNGGVGNGAPNLKMDYWNYMNSTWLDGSPLLFGGDGYNEVTGADPDQPTDYFFPSDPTETVGAEFWNESTAAFPPSDRRGIGASSPFSLNAGESTSVDLVFVTNTPESPSVIIGGGVAALESDAAEALVFFDDQDFSYPEIFIVGVENLTQENSALIYPNPSAGEVNVLVSNPEISEMSISDLSGKIVLRKTVGVGNNYLRLAHLTAGTYVVNFTGANGFSSHQKVVLY